MEIIILEWILRTIETVSISRHAFRWLLPKIAIRITALRIRRENKRYAITESFKIETCDKAHLGGVIQLGKHSFSEITHMTEAQLIERWHRNPNTVFRIVQSNGTAENLAGYFILLPINKACMEAIENGNITEGRGIRSADICKSFTKFSALYVSIVYGSDYTSQFYVSEFLRKMVIILRDAKPELKFLYTRPTTPLGIATFEKHFKIGCNRNGHIEKIELAKYDLGAIDQDRSDRFRRILKHRSKTS